MVVRYDPELSLNRQFNKTNLCYDEYEDVSMEESSSGGYVTFEAYQDLQDELIDTQAELTLLKDKITDLYREM